MQYDGWIIQGITVADACRVFRAKSKGRFAIMDLTRMDALPRNVASADEIKTPRGRKSYATVEPSISFDGGSLKQMSALAL